MTGIRRAATAGKTYQQQIRATTSKNEEMTDELSPRELQVLTLIAEGLTGPQIVEKLGETPGAIHHDLRRIKEKLGASTAAHTVLIACQTGLLKLETRDQRRAQATPAQNDTPMISRYTIT
jgi:DNA-binding NarL/FixJ family response regulator